MFIKNTLINNTTGKEEMMYIEEAISLIEAYFKVIRFKRIVLIKFFSEEIDYEKFSKE